MAAETAMTGKVVSTMMASVEAGLSPKSRMTTGTHASPGMS